MNILMGIEKESHKIDTIPFHILKIQIYTGISFLLLK